jgi:hypothetical protein
MLTETRVRRVKPRRRARKLCDSGGLYVLVVHTGGRYWRYNYRFNGKQKTLALGTYPDVSLEKARARHQAARRLLAAGVDPSVQRRALRQRPTRSPRESAYNAGGNRQRDNPFAGSNLALSAE